ncbi:MAG: S-layer homology domain-containing protein [Oscillibacter sp.]|nr:S-layer homology domain-containing protein [Oscillibacter sp.]
MNWKTRICALAAALALSVSAAAFSDTETHWAKSAIGRWSKENVITGFEDGTFRPDQPITRAQMASLLQKIFGWEAKAENSFSDLNDGAWYADAILKANAAGVIQGGDGRVRPEDTITRQEAAVMLYRAFQMEPQAGETLFPDQASIASWAAEAVSTMAAKGYINGMGDGSFAPTGVLTRAQAATILNNIVSGYYDWAGAYSAGNAGLLVVRAPGVTLQSMTAGDILVTPAACGSETTLSHVQVTGRLMVQAGDRYTSTELVGETKVERLIVSGDNALVQAGEKAEVGEVVITGKNVTLRGLEKGTPVTVQSESAKVNGHTLTTGAYEAGKDISTSGPTIDIVVGGA